MSSEREIQLFLEKEKQDAVNSGRNRRLTVPEQIDRHRKSTEFLLILRNIYDISSIYYPGCGSDAQLEPAFQQREIAYLDKKTKRYDASGWGMVGDYMRPPFSDETFDSIFIQDLHLHEKKDDDIPPQWKLQRILQTGKDNGILIYNTHPVCKGWEKELPFVTSHKQLEPITINSPESFSVFRIHK
jgi:hypothetical protein